MTKQNLNIIMGDEFIIIECPTSTILHVWELCEHVIDESLRCYKVTKLSGGTYKLQALNETLYIILATLASRFTLSIG